MKIEEDYNKIRDCNWISDREARERCYNDVAINIKDETPCDEMRNNWRRDGCYKYVAPYKKDISICDKIIDVPQKYRCYAGVARETKDFDLCKKTEDGRYFKISECYSEAAKAMGDFFIREPVENWLVFNNEEYEYKIKYPRDLLLVGGGSNIGIKFIDSEEKSSEYFALAKMKKLTIYVEKAKSVKEIIDEVKEKVEQTEIYINNKKATQIFYKKIDANENYYIVLIKNNNFIYKIIYIDSEQYGPTFKQILSTFKFVD